ncbi:MAG: cobyrinate a,c-diamide synthase [Lachnospiraceae bacterium]|nr:cobyrinate a,c-diamide synthase [Lachnospiraceae bacterium]
MNYKRVMIAAPKSGSGKTTVTCALLQALINKGYQTASFKCGPDYIDPMFHEKVIGVPSRNLDTFFTGEEQTRRLFLNSALKDGITVLEGVMGLYDGLGGVREEGSSYHLAKVTETPIVLVVDAKGMGRSIVPLLSGFLSYDKGSLIKGVILNRISRGYYAIIKPLIEKELGLPVSGFLPEKQEFHMESRHLGLVRPDELNGIKERLMALAEEFEKTVSVTSVLEIVEKTESAENMNNTGNFGVGTNTLAGTDAVSADRCFDVVGMKTEGFLAGKKTLYTRPVIAVARDEAFCFYYADNILMLEENGAEIRYFSPLHDDKLPEDCHALLFGGGYPELYADKLSMNRAMRGAVKQAVEKGMPVVAECGGFMYLHSAIIDKEGIRHDMAGVIPSKCFDTGKSVRFGYIEMREKKSNFLPAGEVIKGHEFHYYDSTDSGEDVLAVKPVTGRKYSCIMEGDNYWIGFPHLYYPSNPAFAKAFVEKAAAYQRQMAD